MMSMAVSELTVIGQVGTTIGLGLLFDTLVIRVVHDAVDRGAVGARGSGGRSAFATGLFRRRGPDLVACNQILPKE